MRRLLPRRLSPSMIVAFVALMFALAGGGYAAGRWVADSDRVDGLHASATPRAHKLLALNGQRRFPASVLPALKPVPGPAGPKGDPGPPGPQGNKGDASLPIAHAFAGDPGPLMATATLRIWAGPTVDVRTLAGQRLTGTAEAAFGTTYGDPGSAHDIRYGLCYQDNAVADNPLQPFSGEAAETVGKVYSGERRTYVAVGSVAPGAGMWRVGFCVTSQIALDDNGAVNGWVMLTE